jgi:hypothetical protein
MQMATYPINRREFTILLGGTAAWPYSAARYHLAKYNPVLD